MFNGKTFLAIIPARGGSKGLKNKNILPLKGKPLIAYTIETALESVIFDKVIVSTDSKKIANISSKHGAEIPFMRPKELATDTASSIDVAIHALSFFEDQGIHFDYFMLLQPTSPLRTSKDIINAIKLAFEKDADVILSVCEVEHSPLWTNILPDDLSMKHFIREEIKGKSRQQLPKFYRLNGAIYLAKVEYFLKTKDWFGEKSYAYIMPRERSIDIDDYIDFKLAETLMEEYK